MHIMSSCGACCLQIILLIDETNKLLRQLKAGIAEKRSRKHRFVISRRQKIFLRGNHEDVTQITTMKWFKIFLRGTFSHLNSQIIALDKMKLKKGDDSSQINIDDSHVL